MKHARNVAETETVQDTHKMIVPKQYRIKKKILACMEDSSHTVSKKHSQVIETGHLTQKIQL